MLQEIDSGNPVFNPGESFNPTNHGTDFFAFFACAFARLV